MIIINKQPYDPRIIPQSEILAAIDAAKGNQDKPLLVKWFDLSLTQEIVQTYYMPIVHYAQSKDLKVDCLMSSEMSETLVRYKRLMFVDPLFLRKFRFNRIEFTHKYLKDIPYREKE